MTCTLNGTVLAEREMIQITLGFFCAILLWFSVHLTELLVLITVILKQFLLCDILIAPRGKDRKVKQDGTALSCLSLGVSADPEK